MSKSDHKSDDTSGHKSSLSRRDLVKVASGAGAAVLAGSEAALAQLQHAPVNGLGG